MSTDKNSQQLSYTDAEGWIGKEVRVISGRAMGVVARVTSTGNGWVQLETPSGDIAKRAHELSLELNVTADDVESCRTSR